MMSMLKNVKYIHGLEIFRGSSLSNSLTSSKAVPKIPSQAGWIRFTCWTSLSFAEAGFLATLCAF